MDDPKGTHLNAVSAQCAVLDDGESHVYGPAASGSILSHRVVQDTGLRVTDAGKDLPVAKLDSPARVEKRLHIGTFGKFAAGRGGVRIHQNKNRGASAEGAAADGCRHLFENEKIMS
jgi:hypothetical protein